MDAAQIQAVATALGVSFTLRGQPASKLLETVSGALGILWQPAQTVLMAHAKAQEKRVLAAADEDILDEQAKRATARVFLTERRNQENIEAIIKLACEQLPPEVDPAPVNPDWTASFFESCKTIGNSDLRNLWAKLLAGEVARPGKFSLRTLNAVRLMDSDDARVFNDLCAYVWKDGVGGYIFMPEFPSMLRNFGISYTDLLQMDFSGLAILKNDLNLRFNEGGDGSSISHGESRWEVAGAIADVRVYPLTPVGVELSVLADAEPHMEYRAACLDYMSRKGLVLTPHEQLPKPSPQS